MAKPTKITLSKTEPSRSKTLMDKISNAAMEIVDEEAEQRRVKTARLRKARLERDASGTDESGGTAAKDPRKKPRGKTVSKG